MLDMLVNDDDDVGFSLAFLYDSAVLRFLPARRRPQGLVIIGVCLSVRTVFVRKISQERVHGSPPNLVGGSGSRG